VGVMLCGVDEEAVRVTFAWLMLCACDFVLRRFVASFLLVVTLVVDVAEAAWLSDMLKGR